MKMTEHWHELNIPASLPTLFLKAALRRKISGTHLPDQGLRCWISLDPGQLAAYRKVCGFTDNGLLPATYPHVLAFPLQMQLLTASDFPFPLLGLVHLATGSACYAPWVTSAACGSGSGWITCAPTPRARPSTW
ncbi:hypothetical protein P308_03670 [Pseudomonas piscis]|nr:hypothetical protein P308_03670 [Pseudomonas piscis]